MDYELTVIGNKVFGSKCEDDKEPLIESGLSCEIAEPGKDCETDKGICGFLGARHVLVILCFFGLANVYLLRVNLNVAIVSMVKKSGNALVPINGTTCGPRISAISEKSVETEEGEFNWSPYDQGLILGSFFYGYIISNFIGGILAERFGGKIVFGLGILITALLTLLTPLAARNSKIAIIVLRILEGFSEGVVFPALHTICGVWLPKSERAFLYSLLHMGAEIGTVIGFPIAGALSGSHFLGGWPAVFYIFGFMGLVWFMFWWTLMYETPSDHPRISAAERRHILQDLEHKAYAVSGTSTPWAAIFSSVPVWSIAISSVLHSLTFYIVFTDLSSFLDNVLHLDVKSNGIVSSVPHVMNVIMQVIGGYSADLIVSKNRLSRTSTRKIFHFLPTVLQAACFVGAVLSGCETTWVIAFITIGVGVSGLSLPGTSIALLDMAPIHAGTLLGLTNGFGNISGVVAPYLVGVFTDVNESLEQWHKVFLIGAGTSLISAFVFVIFGTSDIQPWAVQNSSQTKEDSKNLITDT